MNGSTRGIRQALLRVLLAVVVGMGASVAPATAQDRSASSGSAATGFAATGPVQGPDAESTPPPPVTAEPFPPASAESLPPTNPLPPVNPLSPTAPPSAGEPWPPAAPPIAFPETLPPAPPTIAGPEAVFSDSGGRGDMFGGMWGPPADRLSYSAAWLPDEDVIRQGTHFGEVSQGFSLSAPLWHNEVNVWSASVGVRSQIISTDAILPDTHQPFPDALWNIHFGTSFRHQFVNGWSEISSIALGSASDKPFASNRPRDDRFQ